MLIFFFFLSTFFWLLVLLCSCFTKRFLKCLRPSRWSSSQQIIFTKFGGSSSRFNTGSINFVKNWVNAFALTWTKINGLLTHWLCMLEHTRFLFFLQSFWIYTFYLYSLILQFNYLAVRWLRFTQEVPFQVLSPKVWDYQDSRRCHEPISSWITRLYGHLQI